MEAVASMEPHAAAGTMAGMAVTATGRQPCCTSCAALCCHNKTSLLHRV
jgi:hypothetical protein